MKAPLSVLLSDAVDEGLIDANPALQLGRRKTARADRLTAAERTQKIRPMSGEQRAAFLEAARVETRYAALFAVLATAGLRPAEVFALKPGDLDFRARTVRVERAWTLSRIKATKTYEDRVVDLSPELARAIERHLAWLKTDSLRRGRGIPEWLFPNEDGQPMDESRVRKVFKQALRRARLPDFRLYDLRHHVREPAAGGERADHVRERAARTRKPVDDAPLLREVDPEPGTAVGRSPGPRGGVHRGPGRPSGSRSGTKVEPETRIGRPRCSGSARFRWWAVKDSNLGPAD